MGDAAHSCIPCFVLGLTDIHAHYIAHGPCRLEVKTSGDAIDIGHFACEKQVRAVLALQGIEVEFAQSYAATGDKLVLEFALAGDGILVIGKRVYQLINHLLAQFSHTPVGGASTLLQNVCPQP